MSRLAVVSQQHEREPPLGLRGSEVLNIAKLVHDQADYYLDAVARSQEEYYSGAGGRMGTGLDRRRWSLDLPAE